MKATLKISFDVTIGAQWPKEVTKEMFEELVEAWKMDIARHATEGIENGRFGDLTIEEVKNLKVGDPKIGK